MSTPSPATDPRRGDSPQNEPPSLAFSHAKGDLGEPTPNRGSAPKRGLLRTLGEYASPEAWLFGRIFLWFWFTMLLISLLLFVYGMISQAQPFDSHLRRLGIEQITQSGKLLAHVIEKGEDGKALATPDSPGQLKPEQSLWLYDIQGKFLLGFGCNSTATSPVLEALIKANLPYFQNPPPDTQAIRVFQDGERHFLATGITSPKGNHYIAAGTWDRRWSTLSLSRLTLLLPRAILMIATTALLCFFFARSMTRPILDLRRLTRGLAGGNLQERVPEHLTERLDEIGALSRDFNVMAEKIEQLLRGRQRLLADISHELRSPLARMHISLELMRKRVGPELCPNLDRMEREITRLDGLIGEILMVSRLDQNDRVDPPRAIPLLSLLKEVAADAEFEAHPRNIRVEVVSTGDPQILGSWELLHRAMENVIRNAVSFTAEGSQVDVTLGLAEGGKDRARIAIRDHGPGVPAEHLEHLFLPFFRCSPSSERRTSGIGLGLTITQKAVQRYGGQVRARNASDGGLIIEIDLPVLKELPPATS